MGFSDILDVAINVARWLIILVVVYVAIVVIPIAVYIAYDMLSWVVGFMRLALGV